MKYTTKGLIFMLIFFFFGGIFVQAQVADTLGEELELVASLNIVDSTIVEQKDNVMDIWFKLSNREQTQSQIRYSVQLLQTSEEGEQVFVVDQVVYDEGLSLGTNDSESVEFEYTAPLYLSGKYGVWVTVANDNGFVFDTVRVGEIQLDGDGQYVEIVSDTCALTVPQEEGDVLYEPNQKIDIDQDEELELTCTVINHSNTAKTFSPSFTTRYRSMYGPQIEMDTPASESTTLDPGETTTVQYKLPVYYMMPQAYVINMELVDADESVLGNSIGIHYIVRGRSATIQNVRLDKDSYAPGDTANVSIFWWPSADNYTYVRSFNATVIEPVKFTLDLQDGQGVYCADSIEEVVSYTHTSDTVLNQFSVNQECNNPTVTVSISEENGAMLDIQAYNIVTPDSTPLEVSRIDPDASIVDDSKKVYTIFFVVTVVSLLLIVVIVVLWRKRKDSLQNTDIPASILFFVACLGATFMFGAIEARADTYNAAGLNTTYGVRGGDPPPPAVQAILDNDPNYHGGSGCVTLTTATVFALDAWEGSQPGHTGAADGAHGVPGMHSGCGSGPVQSYSTCTYNTCGPASGGSFDTRPSGTFRGGVCSGSIDQYSRWFTWTDPDANDGTWNWQCHYAGCGSRNCSANKLVPSVPGVFCGSSNGTSRASRPSSGLCNSGTVAWFDTVASDGTWNWNCWSSNGQGVACAANKVVSRPSPPQSPPPSVSGSCGSSNRRTYSSRPSGGLCSSGSAVWRDTGASDGTWNWRCGSGRNTSWCSAYKRTRTFTRRIPRTGFCGNSDGGTFDTIPRARMDVCRSGSWYWDDRTADDGTWNWRCRGSYGGRTATCSANATDIDGICGTGNGQVYNYSSRPPNSVLCGDGTRQWTDINASDGTWNWNCNGRGGGEDVACFASKQSAVGTLTLTLSTTDFGRVRVGSSKELTFQVNGDSGTHTGTMLIDAGDPFECVETISDTGVHDPSCDYDIGVGEHFLVTIKFTPPYIGLFNTLMRFSSFPGLVAPLTGQGYSGFIYKEV